MKFLLGSLLILSLISHASAWWGTGHVIIARIAFELLSIKAPDTLKQAQTLLTTFTKNKDEGDYSFVECATYADNVKGHGGAFQSGWHFIDQPYLDEGGKISDYNFTFDSHNVTEAIHEISNWITKSPGYKDQYIYTNIMENMDKIHQGSGNGDSEDTALSFALRLLIHYVGDIHQPLHAGTRVDHEYERGDRGGNSFKVPSIDGAYNLHAVYDSVFYEFYGDLNMPMNKTTWTTLGDTATDLMNKYPVSKLGDVTDLECDDWAKESLDIISSFTYKEINHHEK